jgi:hypothetical protein
MLGESFAPTGQSEEERRRRLSPVAGSGGPAQEAIRTLSLRIPRTNMQGSPVPLPLLMSPGSGGNPAAGNPLMAAILSSLFPQLPQGGGMSPGMPSMSPGASGATPLPKVNLLPSPQPDVDPGPIRRDPPMNPRNTDMLPTRRRA